MGMVFGKVDVAEPAFQTLLSRTAGGSGGASVLCAYDIRRYGKRFAIETEWTKQNENGTDGVSSDLGKETKSPFYALAGYIGVMGKPENEGSRTIAMTAPVVMDNKEEEAAKEGGEKITMTAPVVTGESGSDSRKKRMQFILPAEYDDISKIPKPTNPNVHVKEVPSAVGAVHRFTGSFDEKIHIAKAKELGEQLRQDGIQNGMDEESVKQKYQFWGYNPPFTIPFLRRNEVWIELSEEHVNILLEKFGDNQQETKK